MLYGVPHGELAKCGAAGVRRSTRATKLESGGQAIVERMMTIEGERPLVGPRRAPWGWDCRFGVPISAVESYRVLPRRSPVWASAD